MYSEIALSWKRFGIGHMYIYKFLVKMTYTMTSQNIDLSSWDTLYIVQRLADIFLPGNSRGRGGDNEIKRVSASNREFSYGTTEGLIIFTYTIGLRTSDPFKYYHLGAVLMFMKRAQVFSLCIYANLDTRQLKNVVHPPPPPPGSHDEMMGNTCLQTPLILYACVKCCKNLGTCLHP
jgi:hypothetical protein